MNRKGDITVVRFLVGLVLALLIFGSLMLFSSKFFRLSSQGKESFQNFVNELRLMSTTFIGDTQVTMLLLDEETAVVYFEHGNSEVKVEVDADCSGCEDYSFTVEKPNSCADDKKGCLCLFQEVVYDVSESTFIVKPQKAFCDDSLPSLKLPVCGVGRTEDVNNYVCYGGFLIERTLVKEASWRVQAYYELPRRVPLSLTKEADDILLEVKV